MPRHFSRPFETYRAVVIVATGLAIATPIQVQAGGVTGQATEWTQLANNA
ncbi:MAG: conjugal transfer protein TrbJ, partial [Zymomonas sp.]